MTGKLLLRGMIAGVVGGLLAFLFARVYGEPLVDFAIAFEEQASAAAGGATEPELVSRATQAGLGLLTGVVVYGAALGGMLSLVFALAYGRFSALDARSLAALLALAGFLAVILVPTIKYPANPPAIGNGETIGLRTELYFLMLLASVALMIAAIALARHYGSRLGGWNAALLGGLAYVAAIAVVMALLPEDQRGAGRLLRRPALALPPGLARPAGDHLGDGRPAVRLPRRASAPQRPAQEPGSQPQPLVKHMLEIHPSKAADHTEIVKLWHQGWHEAHAGLVPAEVLSFRTEGHFATWLKEAQDTFYLARNGAELLGFVSVKGAEVVKLYVGAPARGSGTAHALLSFAERLLCASGVSDAELLCTAGNSRAEKFYDREGWRLSGTHDEALWMPKGDGRQFLVPTHRFQKALTPAT